MPGKLTDGQVIINNENVAVNPNSVSRKFGRGETSVENQSLGNGITEAVYSTNQETAKSYFKIEVKPTADNIKLVDAWKLNEGLNVIRYIAGSRTEIYESMSVINDPEYPDSNDGNIEVEFEGQSLVK